MKDLTSRLFQVPTGTATMPAAGQQLISAPFVHDDLFRHGVLTIIDYDSHDGATGVVMGSRTGYTLSDLLDGIDDEFDIPVYCGGPEGQDRLYFVHNLGNDIVPGARPCGGGLYVGGDFDTIMEYINDGYPTEGSIRFFVGYCTWEPGQLEQELRSGYWAPTTRTANANPAATSHLFSTEADALWHAAVRTLGEDFRPWSLIPRNPVCN